MQKVIYVALFLLTTAIFLSACKDDDNTPNCLPDFEADPPGRWYFGDFHVHATGASNDTGGDSYPPDIKAIAVERGLDFLVLTDHSNSTGSDHTTTEEDPALFNQGSEFPYWSTTQSLSDDNFLMISGNEISPVAEEDNLSQPTGHIACIPMDLATFDTTVVFIDRPRGTVTGAQTVQQAKDAGCFAILNHPYSLTPWIAFDWTSYDYDAIEIWNGTIGYDNWDKTARDIWLCDLLAGRKTVAVGGSDNHRIFTPIPGVVLDPALAYPTTAVYAQRLEWTAIMESLKAGQTMIFEGNSRLQIDAYNEQGCFNESRNTRWIRLRGKADENLTTPKVLAFRFTDCEDFRPGFEAPILAADTLLIQDVQANTDFDIQIPINGESGVYTAQVMGEPTQGHYWALGRAVVIE